MITQFLLAVVLTEALTEILVASVLTERPRVWIRKKFGEESLVGYFVGCGYCVSVWLGVGAAYLCHLSGPVAALGLAEPLLWGVAVHRASNLWHEAVARFLGRLPFTLFVRAYHREEPWEPPGKDGQNG